MGTASRFSGRLIRLGDEIDLARGRNGRRSEMPSVRVRFTAPEYDKANPPNPIPPPRIDISHEAVRVQSEGFIVWEIESTDDRVEKVKIVAEDIVINNNPSIPASKLFREADVKATGNGPLWDDSDTQRVKTFAKYGHVGDPQKDEKRAYALIWGLAPQVPDPTQRKVDKYGIYGVYKENGIDQVVSRDPEIITDPPPIPGVEVPG
jgi:hypothetical protein